MKSKFVPGWRKADRRLLASVFIAASLLSAPLAHGQNASVEKGTLFATQEQGFVRLILDFPDRQSLPPYQLRMENGVLSVEFTERVDVPIPDISMIAPDYISIARVDPDGRGLRVGLRNTVNYNSMEAGERLFIDLLPLDWQGLPPGLPQDVVDELAERARLAAIKAEQQRKADGVRALHPTASVRIGRNPTFLRLQFDWNVDTKASYEQAEETGTLSFEWPVPIDLSDLELDLPAEIEDMDPDVTPDGTRITMRLAEGVKPRFYQSSPRQTVLDFDLAGATLPQFTPAELRNAVDGNGTLAADEADGVTPAPSAETLAETVKPFINVIGSTVRVVFPFAQDTPAAVFRRGDTVWMIFDTVTGIDDPAHSAEFDALASGFEVSTEGDTQVVRIDLSQDRLATLGSEGMAWVLSLGDTMLAPTEPIELSRRRDVEGLFEIAADVERPARVHEFRDPVVGDKLKVVTAYPPARGVMRSFDYVDFSALKSVHGFVIKPEHLDVDVAIEDDMAVVTTPGGLTISAFDRRPALDSGVDAETSTFVDLATLEESNLQEFARRRDELIALAAAAEEGPRDAARLRLAQYFIANQFAQEAIGVLHVLEAGLKSEDLLRQVRLTTAIADTVAGRSREAVQILNAAAMSDGADALMWRTIARSEAHDYSGARDDALEAQGIEENYPAWVRNRFRLSAIRAAVETGDAELADRLLEAIDVATLDVAEVSLYNLLSGRLDEVQGRTQEALDTYGQVIATDIRPTRAEAIYRTMLVLDQTGKLDLAKATETLSAEAMLWRGNPLEAAMQKLLAELYFRDGAYRLGFETVRQAVAYYPENPPINALRDEAARVFGDLYLNGLADTMPPVEALSLFYDFRNLTPSGAQGDEMIRNLVRRLVKVDLLPQAAQLLEYQIDNRLGGIGKTQVAADLAVIYLADRRPGEALRVLNGTRLADIPASLARQRRILEVRALIDGGRGELALEIMRDMEGRDVDMLRVEAHWRARRYSRAGELLEALYSATPAQDLTHDDRMNIIRAGAGYVLNRDSLGLSRLRAKFSEAMVTAPEWPMFDLVTRTIEPTSLEFKRVAREMTDIDSINAFLTAYRETYGGTGALAPETASSEMGKVASAED